MIDNLLNVLIFGVIPILSVVIFFFVKRKVLWIAPIISTVLAFVTYIISFNISGMSLSEILGNNEWRAFFLLALIIQLVIVIALTAIAYLIAYILKRKKNK